MALRYFKHEDCDKNGNKYGSYSCMASPYGGNECVASGGGGGGMKNCHDCLTNCPNQRPRNNPDPGHGNFGIATLPGITNDWAKCAEPTDDGKCFTGLSHLTGNKINCVTCDRDEKTDCGQLLINSGIGDCIPDTYINECCKNKIKTKPIITTKPPTKSNTIWNQVWPPMTITIVVLLLCLLIWYFSRPKKSKFAVYWRR